MKKPATQRIESYKLRIVRAQKWQKFYKPNAGACDEANYNHWVGIEADLSKRLKLAEAEVANEVPSAKYS